MCDYDATEHARIESNIQERSRILGYRPQRELPWNKYLPYADQIDDESQIFLNSIKENLAKAVAMRDFETGVGMYTSRLLTYIKLYGLKFSKEDHINFIKLYLELLKQIDLQPLALNSFCIVLLRLFQKPYWLRPDDLVVEWKPLYKLFVIFLHKTSSKGNCYQYFAKPNQQDSNQNKKESSFDEIISLAKSFDDILKLKTSITDETTNTFVHNIKLVIADCSIHFPSSATQEIIDEVLPNLQPLDTGKPCQIFEILLLFLNFRRDYSIWFDDFMALWNTYQNPPWSEDMMSIMGQLAFRNLGKIDWEPYIPVIFTRILRWIDLPVSYKHLRVFRNQNLCSISVAKWIVSVLGPKTSGQEYLRKLIGAIESYLHPANLGKWIKVLGQLLYSLPEQLCNRLEYERFRKMPWEDPVPDSYKLTEDCITKFVECLKPAAFQAMYSRMHSDDVYKLFKHLSNLRPELIIPEVIDRVYANLESLTEPHRLTASLQCLVGVSRALICGHNGYTAGRTHVIPILFAVLPGIDLNDLRKAVSTINFYSTFVLQIPIVDCSKAGLYYDDLTEEEILICEQTADFEDFVLQFIDRLFIIIRYTTQESIRMEQTDADNKSRYDIILQHSFATGVRVIFGQCSEEISLSASKKIIDFVKSNLLEPHVATHLLGTLVGGFLTGVTGTFVYKSLVPYLHDCIMAYISEHENIADLEKQPDDLLYHLTILYYLVKNEKQQILSSLDEYLLPIIDELVKFKCKLTAKITCDIVYVILFSLSRYHPISIKSEEQESNKPLNEYLPIRHWGEKMGDNETIKFYIPGEPERVACEKIIHRYLLPTLDVFEKHVKGECNLEREDILRNINLVVSLISLSNYLPNWEEPSKQLVNTVVDIEPPKIISGFEGKEIKMPDGKNVRLAIIETMGRLQDKILESSGDDIQSLKSIISLWSLVHIQRTGAHSYDAEMKSYKHWKQFQEFKLVKRKRNIKAIVGKRVTVQQACRREVSMPRFTETHCKIIKKLLMLSVSHYSAVRSTAQASLFAMLDTYSKSYNIIIEDLVDFLNLDSNQNHETFKGTLYTLMYPGRVKLLVKHDWKCIQKLWPTILRSIPSEKPSIVHLFDAMIYAISDKFTTMPIEYNISDNVVDFALALSENVKKNLSADEIENGKRTLEETSKSNLNIYYNVIETIISIAQNESLHWRYHLLATTMIKILVHPTVKYPPIVGKYYIQNLIHDSIKERKVAMHIVNSIFIQQKRKHLKVNVDPFEIAGVPKPEGKVPFGVRDDNRWLQYDINSVPKNQEDWDKPCYAHKSNGFFGWSSDFKVYAPTSEQPKLDRNRDEMNETEQIIYDFFSSKENIEKFIRLWSLEERKGKEKFKQMRFFLIKYLFKSFGDMFFENFKPHLRRLIEENKLESNHRCAAELLSGIMQAMKHWPYDKCQKMYEEILPLIRLALNSITVETDDFWGTCFATASERVDPKKQYWLHEVLIEEPLKESTSFIDCCRIFCLQGTFNQHVWRMDTYAHRLLNYLRPFLNHPFQNVRTRLGSILINIFEADLKFKNGNTPECPRVEDMVREVVEKIQVLHKEMPAKRTSSEGPDGTNDTTEPTPEQKEYDEAVRLFKTISQWIVGAIARNTNGNEKSYFDLLPFACRLEGCEQDAELAQMSTYLISMISQALTLPDIIGYGLDKFNEISFSSSWGSRVAVIDALQVFVFHNMAIISSRDEWVQKVQDIVLRLLEDTNVEVREKAAQVLGGLLHCSFLPATDRLLDQFKKKCKTKMVRSNRRYETGATIGEVQENEAVRLRHTGVLGLCAFISAHPYEIPDFVPDVFEHLGAHLNDPQPIPSTIRKTVGDFKRTHHDNWAVHQLKFTEDQLEVLSDLTIPPSYYT